MQKLLKVGFGMKADAPVEEIEVDISSDEAAQEQEQETPEEPDVAGEVEVEDSNQQKNEEL